MKYFFLLGNILIWTVSTVAQPGTPDLSFGNNGIVTANIYSDAHCFANHILTYETGEILVTGNSNKSGAQSIAFLLRYLEDGSPDPDFGTNGRKLISVPDVACYGIASVLQPDEKILSLLTLNGSQESTLAIYRTNTNGSPDMTFGTEGRALYDLGSTYQGAKTLTLQPDGKLLIGGYTGNLNDDFDRFFVVRLMPDGTADETFGVHGMVVTSVGESWTSVGSVLVQPDGKILAAGYGTWDEYECFAVMRYLSNGTPDLAFGQNGLARVCFPGGSASGYRAALQPDGKIVLAGIWDPGDGDADFAAARLLPNGTLDQQFDNDGIVTIPVTGYADAARSVVLQPDGKILLGGYIHSNAPESSYMAFIRLLANGKADTDFSDDGYAEYHPVNTNSSAIYHMALQADGKVVATGLARIGDKNQIGTIRFHTGIVITTSVHTPFADALEIFPNPAHDVFTVSFTPSLKRSLSIELLDSHGRIIEELQPALLRDAQAQSEQFQLPQHLVPGMYFIRLRSEGNVQVERLLVQ